MKSLAFRLVLMGGTAGSPHGPPSLTPFVPLAPLGAAPAMSVAATEPHSIAEALR